MKNWIIKTIIPRCKRLFISEPLYVYQEIVIFLFTNITKNTNSGMLKVCRGKRTTRKK